MVFDQPLSFSQVHVIGWGEGLTMFQSEVVLEKTGSCKEGCQRGDLRIFEFLLLAVLSF